MDWDRFGFEYRIEREGLFPSLVQIEAYKEAALNLVLPPDWRNWLDRLNRIRVLHGTTALEGNPLSEEEVGRQIDIIDHPDEAKTNATKEQRQIRNAGIAQNWVRRRFAKDHKPLGVHDLLHLHKTVTEQSDEHNNIPGRFRDFSVKVGTKELGGVHRGAPHERLPKLMEEYVQFVQSKRIQDDHPVVRALVAHFFLVTIHPFGDGNGRVSRLVEAGILFEQGYNVHGFYGLSNYFYRNQDEYKILLQRSRQRYPFDLSDFVRFGIRGFSQELKGINNFIKTKLNRVIYRTMLARAREQRVGARRRLLNPREYSLLDFLISETEPNDPFSDEPSKKLQLSDLMASRYIRELYRDVTRRTFVRELIRLHSTGFIGFNKDAESKSMIVELDFTAIGKY